MQSAVAQNSKYAPSTVAWLRLLHLADSALPIGTLAHSFGVESLVAEAGLTEANLHSFFAQWLSGAGKTEAVFCVRGASVKTKADWQLLNEELSAFKPARETRGASLRMGKRLLGLASVLIEDPRLRWPGDAHLATAFGFVGAILELECGLVAAAYLHQSIFGALSACQRLLPLGQSDAMKHLWEFKIQIAQIAEEAATAAAISPTEELWSLQPMLDIASMRHPYLTTRLFIS
jgi:urease accessory protein